MTVFVYLIRMVKQVTEKMEEADKPLKNGETAMWSNTRVVNVNTLFHKNKICSMIRTSGTIFNSLLYFNSRLDCNGLHYCTQ